MAEEEAIKASSTRPAAAAGSASGSSTKPMVDKKATANPANMTVRKSTPNASSSSLVSGPNSTKPRPLSSSNKSQLASSASAGGALNAPKSQARPPPPTQKPPSLQKAATTFLENDKATSNRTNRTQKSMSNAVAGGGGVAKQQTQASASQQSSHPRGLEVPSRCTPKMVPQANPRTSNMVPSSAKTKEKQQSKKDQTSSSGGDNNPQRKLQQHQTIGNSNKERFHRQRSFVLNVPNEETAERKSPRFKRSRTQSCMLPPSKEAVSFAARKRASNSTSEQHDNRQLNPQAKEFVMNRELPGVSDEVANCFSDQERAILFDALQTTSQHQPSNAVTRSKVKSLIEGADVILKAVLRGSLTNINASIVVAKMVEIDTAETFIESLMNCCKEHHSTITSRDKGPARESSSTHAFLTFLGDLYQLQLRGSVKSHRHYQKEELNPCLFLLTLLSEWCQQTLLDMSQGLTKAFQEVDMLSKILPLVGRDERHLLMVGTTTQLMHLLRDAFLWNLTLEEGEEGKVTRHKLLHLIELQSGDWQLSSSALLYYNPTMNNSPLGNEIQVI